MTRVGVVTQARTTSTRLPGKVLLDLGGRSVLDRHLDRLAGTGYPVFVATTTNATDDPVAALAERRGVGVFRGDEQDVLSRFAGCARVHELDVVVRVTSDCPFVDPELVRRGVQMYLAADDARTYVANTLERTFPRGMDFEVFSAEALREADARAVSLAEREHVTPYLYHHPDGTMNLRNLAWHQDKSGYRVTLDTEDDLRLARVLVEEYAAQDLDCAEIIEVLDAHPEVAALNRHIEQKKLDER